MTDSNTTIAVIGFGRFGKLLVEILLKNSNAKIILVSSKKRLRGSYKNLMQLPITAIKDADIIIPCVPISNFESVIKNISLHIKKGSLVMDICSVKQLPVEIMKKELPHTVQIVATHPMFGPDSFHHKNMQNRLRLVMANIRTKRGVFKDIRSFFQQLGLTVIALSPKDHDRMMAMTLGYSYLIGKISQKMGMKKTVIDTYDFTLLIEQAAIVQNDSDELFFDMQTKNPFAKNVQQKIKKSFEELLGDIERRT